MSQLLESLHYTSKCADPPSKPEPTVSYSQDGTLLTLSWKEPFSHPGFPITHYTLQITNVSNPSIHNPPVNISYHLSYIDSVASLPTACNELEYNVTAFNEIGKSAVGSVTGGFPISKFISISFILAFCQIFLLQIFCLLIFNGKPFIKQMGLHTWRYGLRQPFTFQTKQHVLIPI